MAEREGLKRFIDSLRDLKDEQEEAAQISAKSWSEIEGAIVRGRQEGVERFIASLGDLKDEQEEAAEISKQKWAEIEFAIVKGTQQAAENAEKLRNQAETESKAIARSLTDDIVAFMQGRERSFAEVGASLGLAFGKKLLESALSQLIFDPVLAALKTQAVTGGVTGLLGLGGFLGFLQTGPGEFFKVPGPASQGRPAIVHGGEVVGRPTGQQAIIIEARTDPGVFLQIRREIRDSRGQAVVIAVNSVREERLRGGNFSRAFD